MCDPLLTDTMLETYCECTGKVLAFVIAYRQHAENILTLYRENTGTRDCSWTLCRTNTANIQEIYWHSQLLNGTMLDKYWQPQLLNDTMLENTRHVTC